MTGRDSVSKIEMNTLVTEQITSFIAMIQHAGVPALRIAFTIAVLAMSGVGLYTFQKRHQLFDQIPKSTPTQLLLATTGLKKSFLFTQG